MVAVVALLDRTLKKSKAPYRASDIVALIQQYHDHLQILTWPNAQGGVAGFAILAAPVPMFGRTTCTVLAAGSDGTVDARKALDDIKQRARTWGADTLMGMTYRNPRAFVRRLGATIDSVNLRWDL